MYWLQLRNYSYYYNHFTALWILFGITQNKHSPTHIYVVINHPLFASSIYYDPWHPPSSIYVPDSLFPQSLFKFSLVYFLAWHSHTSYFIHSLPNHCLLFAAHAHKHHNLFCCSTKIMSSNPSLFVKPLLGTLSCSLTPHIHLTILISVCWSAT